MLEVTYIPSIPGVCYANILWEPRWRMRNGKFPREHICSSNPRPFVLLSEEVESSNDPLGQFRARGYKASCFPEGDGIVFAPSEGKTDTEIIRDIEECFGFKVKITKY